MDNNQPIIIKRVKKVEGGHHGGAWKIAFADFMTAMMAFFLVMWLLISATPEQRIAIAGYFQDPIGFTDSGSPYVIDLGGTPTPSPDQTLNPTMDQQPKSENMPSNPDDVPSEESSSKPTPGEASGINADLAENIAEKIDKERLQLLLQELQNKIDENPDLQRFKDQILLEITQDGLRIQIVDAENRPMFDSGSAQLKFYFENILLAMADSIKQVPNKISVSGHTDAKPFVDKGYFGNWELSAARANAARRALIAGGYPDNQVARVVGFASSALFDRKDPLNPVNRRIDIVVLTKRALRNIEGDSSSEAAPSSPVGPPPEDRQGAASDASGGVGSVRATNNLAQPLNPQDLQQKLNAFDDGALKMTPPSER
ncbi:chemotaxis protein MotB [Pseudomonas duriflava]|uniref:Chemotaxis protein MotB n=1 Tax=Pseudomonas duriflava TaxID=459528 RepID=A0A562Q6Q9_9PSED|nr:flagellar motor protein MotB [Pseudomonas duriflava]TWI52398.1 chemotaxis protein MotB [Pseudomonas duriflava]